MKHKYLTAVSFSGVGCVLLLRALQLLTLIDGSTGFGKVGREYTGLNITVYLITGLVAVAIFVLTSFFSKRQPVSAPDMSLSPSLSVFCFIMVLYHLFGVGAYLLSGKEITTTFGALYLIFLSVSIVFYILYGISGFSSVKFPKLLSVAPVLLCGYNLISAFIGYTGMANISDSIYECIFLCLALFFFLLHGKVISSVEIRRSARMILPTACLMVLFGVLVAVAPLVTALLGGVSVLHTSPITTLSALFPTAYALAFTLNLYKK